MKQMQEILSWRSRRAYIVGKCLFFKVINKFIKLILVIVQKIGKLFLLNQFVSSKDQPGLLS